jgi:hypothetical protein
VVDVVATLTVVVVSASVVEVVAASCSLVWTWPVDYSRGF